MHLAKLAVSSSRPVSALAAVTRVAVLGPRVAQTVAVDVAQVPLLAGLDALMAAGAVHFAGCDETFQSPTLSAMRCPVLPGDRASASSVASLSPI